MRNSLYALCLLLSVACSKKQDPEPKKEPAPIKLPEAVSGLTCDYKRSEYDSIPYKLIKNHINSVGRIYITTYYERNGKKVTTAYIKTTDLEDTVNYDPDGIMIPCDLPKSYHINHLRVLFSGEETNEKQFMVLKSTKPITAIYCGRGEGSLIRLSSIRAYEDNTQEKN